MTGIRYFIVPPDIAAVPRTSPVRARKHTPWHPQPDGQAQTPRAGEREWFSDRLFVESQDGHTGTGYGASLGAHVFCGALLGVFMLTRTALPAVVRAGPGLVMPAIVSPMPEMPVVATPSQPVERSSSSALAVVTPAPAPPPPPDDATPAPIEAPSGITPETGTENLVGGVEGGVAGGIAGGVVGGTGTAPSVSTATGPGVLRVGAGGVKPPRKIKDVKPVYPDGALPARSQGAVLIEAVIGADGRVLEAKLLHSVSPLLDQAALEAVRQWEYEPPLLRGLPVAVVMTIVVNFGIQ